MQDRAQQLEQFFSTYKSSWDFISKEIQDRIDGHVLALIAADCPEIRGRIKALRDMRDLPVTLTHELQAIKAELTT